MKISYRKIFAIFIGVIISVALLEIFLRIYNPFPFRVKSDKIFLPVNKVYLIKNAKNSKLDQEIKHTKNSLGFRGNNPPENLQNYLSIICVGGSTTECYYLSDEKTWPHLLEEKLKSNFNSIWINNAGIDGHSTYGHLILLKDYLIKLKPKIIIISVGGADISRDDLNDFDTLNIKGKYISFRDFIKKNSEVANLIVNIGRCVRAKKLNLQHVSVDLTRFDQLSLPINVSVKELKKHKVFVAKYKHRLLELVRTAKDSGIDPILVTQPILWGKGMDNITNVNLETLKLKNAYNAKLDWDILELYNSTTKDVGVETDTLVIDLAQRMPKSSLFFYDRTHYTNQGAVLVADIIGNEIEKYLRAKYSEFLKNSSIDERL